MYNYIQGVGISYIDGVKALRTAMKCVEQQDEATRIDIMMLQRWHDLGAKKWQLSESRPPSPCSSLTIILLNFNLRISYNNAVSPIYSTLFVCSVFLK